ncbi:MAG: Flp pilus assembly complex ATPase component TadA [Candidatus Aenigmarchaeota archaeon]|nr:Flp pilus assembly complex ATPase component TadA [Candidatus Aenigmarchaeota archaeon]
MRKAAAKKQSMQEITETVEKNEDASKAVGKIVSRALAVKPEKGFVVPKSKVRLVVRKLIGASGYKQERRENPIEEIINNPQKLKKIAEKYGVSESSIEDIYHRLTRLEDRSRPGMSPEDMLSLRNDLASVKSAPDFGRLNDIDEIRQSLSGIEERLENGTSSAEDKLREAEIERDSLVKSKDEVERKYYKREIDEQTFKKMISDYEQQLIKTEEKIKSYRAQGTKLGIPRPGIKMDRVFEKYAKGFKAVYFPVYGQAMQQQMMQPVQAVQQNTESLRPIIAIESKNVISKSVIDGIEIPDMSKKAEPIDAEQIENIMNINVVYPLIPRAPAKGETVYSYTNIKWDQPDNALVYNVFEPGLTAEEKHILSKSKELLEERLNIDLRKLRKAEAVSYLMRQTDDVFSLMGIKLDQKRVDVLKYYIKRDFVGLERIDPMMNDPNIEDISCDGTNIPIYIFHRNPLIGSIRTNVKFTDQRTLDNFAVRLAQRAGKNISVANPLLDGTLTDGSRVQATLGTDIARRGSNFTIRKFTDIPLTPIDMLNYGTMNATALAYLWMAVENGKSVLIGGSTASGKTTLLNVLSLFIKPNKKIISIEDSVTGDSEILVNRNGSFEKLPIEKLVDGQIEKYGNEKDVFGTEYCQTNPEGVQTFSMDTEGKIKLCPVRSFVRHRVNKDVLEVTTRAGRRIKVTGDHSLFSLDTNGKIIPVEARSLLKGSFIATPRTLPHDTRKLESINLLSEAKYLEGVFVEGDGLKHIPIPELVRAGANGRQKNKCITDGLIPVEIFNRLNNAEEFIDAPGGLSIKAGRGGKAVKAVLKLTDEFLTLVGLWLADGCYDKNSVLISAANDAECKYSIEQAASQLGLDCKYHSDGITYMINSTVLKKVMENILGIRGDAYTKRVPDWVYNLGIEQISCLLKGYFSGDGSVSKDEIEASSSSIGLIKDVHTMMLRLGIMSRFTTKIKERDKTYRIRISGSENLKMFCKKIGFLQKYKQEKLANRSLIFANHTITDVIPVTKEFLSALAEEGAIFNSNSYWYGSKIGRNAMGKAVLQGEGKFLSKAAQLANSDLLWDEILEIRNLGKTELYVYDLSVPNFENFVCENVIAHNTPELRLPHPHWVPEVARTAISDTEGRKMGEVDMFDLLKESLRQRPDYIIVGEVRGKEAYVLFQQMASGHPGMSTIHADSISKLVDRLTTPPISLPGNLIQNLDVLIFSDTTSFKSKNVRKIDTIMEIVGYENGAPVGNVVFKWDPVKNYLRVVGKSALLKKIAYSNNMSEKNVREEISNRVKVLEWMQDKGINGFSSVAKMFNLYTSDPEKALAMVD